jgi:hypothetical protein
MISTRQYLPFTIVFLLLASLLNAQGTAFTSQNDCKPPKNRELFHDYVDREQKNILRSGGKTDSKFAVSPNEEINFLVSQALITRVDALQCKIEKDTIMGSQVKIGYLRGLEKMLRFINGNIKSGEMNVASLPKTIEAYENAMDINKAGESIEDLINGSTYEVGKAVLKSEAFEKNPGIKKSKEIILLKYCSLYPDRIFVTLTENPGVSFLDSIVKVAAYKYPRKLYDYAVASNKLGYAIRRIDDPLVKTVSKMATSKGSGQLYFPFLDNILKGKMTFEDIDEVKNDSIKYYKLLVQTKLDYAERALNKDTAYEVEALNTMLEKKAHEVFVNVINGLHEENDAVRFKIIQQLNAQELYYLAVLSDGIIYTSSFVRGVYPLMMSKINQQGDSLLRIVKFDRYRKFIRMAAGYNTLSNFLSSFQNQERAEKLMQAFVGGLEKANGLEDGVDVADSYASIAETIKPLANEMLNNVRNNYERNVQQNDKRGMVIYNLLDKLFLSADSTNNIDLSRELGIPPVYSISYRSLANDSGQIIMQVFFYGDKDKDGQNSFVNFMNMFKNKSEWKISANDNWVTVNSVKGKPISIFANRPLLGENDPDEAAQNKLIEFLAEKKLKPTIVIHRGHSYHVNSTISKLPASAQIVVLGSCGGYNNLNEVLTICENAHIISSKQVGTKSVNEPILQAINSTLLAGKNIDWISMWKDLSSRFQDAASKEKFDDYIPPYKNLGAIFIKAYKKSMGPML